MSRSIGEDGEAVDRLSGDILEVRLRFFGCRRRRTVMNVRPGRCHSSTRVDGLVLRAHHGLGAMLRALVLSTSRTHPPAAVRARETRSATQRASNCECEAAALSRPIAASHREPSPRHAHRLRAWPSYRASGSPDLARSQRHDKFAERDSPEAISIQLNPGDPHMWDASHRRSAIARLTQHPIRAR